jgi:antitoxin ParD1/3/4
MARESTLNVSLTPSLREYVRSKVRAGGYDSASEVIRESLRVMQDRDKVQQEFWMDVRRKVAVAKRQIAEGKTVDGEAAMRRIIAESDGGQGRKQSKARAR